jgi:hypothetical protein
MKKLLLILLLLCHVSEASDMKLIGEGTLTVLFFKVYDVRLLADSKPFSWENKFQLEFEYRRTIKKENVIESTIKELHLQPTISEKDIDAWRTHLSQSIEPVQEGTRAEVAWNPKGQITFHYEGSQPTVVLDEKFARAFLNIWLGESSSQPKLRDQLLGEQGKD